MKQTEDKRQTIKRDFSYSQVDIIVPFHGQYEHVTKLIESIYRTTRRPFLLTLVDDASPNAQYLQNIKDSTNVNCIRNEEQIGFGASLKVGFEATNFPWVVFMHSDCYIENPNWLNTLGESMMELKDQGVKMVSAVMDNPGGADWIHPKMKIEANLLQQNIPNTSLILPDIVLNENYCLPLVCALSHRDLYRHIGGFVKPYPYGWYEDVELSYRMRKHGFKQALCQKCWIKHKGQATIGPLLATEDKSVFNQMSEENYQRCLGDLKKLA